MNKGLIEYAPDFLNGIANGAGYDAESAISELIDNSIGANAKEIRIAIRDGRFIIEDRGESAGMDEKTLKHNFFYGGASSTKNNSHAAGKFGIGGKTGVIALIGNNLSTDIEITTHKKGNKAIYAKWEYTKGRNNRYEYDILSDDSVPFGTSIEFDCETDRIKINNLMSYISVTYCWAINSGIRIYVNDIAVLPSDPLYRTNGNVKKWKIFSSKSFSVAGEKVTVNITQFDTEHALPEYQLNSFDNSNNKKKTVLTANRCGIFVKTEYRYYTFGNNFDEVLGGTNHASLDGLRVEVDIPKSLWDLIGITWNKGKNIIPFSNIAAFSTGDINTGVFDYIKSVTSRFRNGKDYISERSIKSYKERLSDSLMDYGRSKISVNVVSNEEQAMPFATLKKNNLTFNILASPMRKSEMLGTMKTLTMVVNTLVERDETDLAKDIISKF